jgi:CheY-like chemotaxis protein
MVDPTAADGRRAHSDGATTILVVEDNPVNQIVAQRLLARLGYEADVAADGELALEMMAVRPYALVLMDCRMPVLDGYETTREIRRRERRAGAERVPIIALTAHALDLERERCLDAGMDAHLAKPVEATELAAVLECWLGPRQA